MATWNTEMKFSMKQYSYKKILEGKTKKANCQAFARAVLAEIKAPNPPWWNLNGPIGI